MGLFSLVKLPAGVLPAAAVAVARAEVFHGGRMTAILGYWLHGLYSELWVGALKKLVPRSELPVDGAR